LKKYCECYAAGTYCEGCDCTNCYNTPSFSEMIKKSIEYRKESDGDKEQAEKLEISCNCTKSNCKKKYCECYKAGEGCKDICRCINCSNNKEVKPVSTKKSTAKKCSPEDYTIEGISVYINNNDVNISFSKNNPKSDKKVFFKVNNVQQETPKMIKKRNRPSQTEEIQKTKSTSVASTPLFTTSNDGMKTRRMVVEDEKKIIKNLDKLY
jgi:hypothetical protein